MIELTASRALEGGWCKTNRLMPTGCSRLLVAPLLRSVLQGSPDIPSHGLHSVTYRFVLSERAVQKSYRFRRCEDTFAGVSSIFREDPISTRFFTALDADWNETSRVVKPSVQPSKFPWRLLCVRRIEASSAPANPQTFIRICQLPKHAGSRGRLCLSSMFC